MDIVLQQIVNAISLGGIYALLALGLAVIFSIISLINFAHGELMTVAGYGMFFAAAVSLPFPFAVCVAVLFAVIAALLTERLAFRPMRKADATGLLLTSFAVSAILRVIFQNGISARPKPVPLPSGFASPARHLFQHPLLRLLERPELVHALRADRAATEHGGSLRLPVERFGGRNAIPVAPPHRLHGELLHATNVSPHRYARKARLSSRLRLIS